MDILSLAIGVTIGALTTCGLLGHYYKMRLKRRDAELHLARVERDKSRQAEQEQRHEAQQALEKAAAADDAIEEAVSVLAADLEKTKGKLKTARNERRTAKRHLTKATANAEASVERIEGLEKDLAAAKGKLTAERDAHKQAKKLVSDLRADADAAGKHIGTLEADLKRARSASKKAVPADAASAEEVEQLHQEISQLTTRLNGSEAARASAEEARARVDEQLQQALDDAYAAREEDSARLGEIQHRLSQQDAAVNRLRAELAWAQVAAEDTVKACDANGETARPACQWSDDPNQEKLASMILDAAKYKSSGGQNGQPLSIRNVMALSDRFGWNNKEAASRITHAVSKIRSKVDEETFRAVEAEAEQFYFTYTA